MNEASKPCKDKLMFRSLTKIFDVIRGLKYFELQV